jgi:hypothetical protein
LALKLIKDFGSSLKLRVFLLVSCPTQWKIILVIGTHAANDFNKEIPIPIPILFQSVTELFKSRYKDNDFYKAIALIRHGFGGHPFGADEYIATERKTSRIQKI